MIPKSCQTFRIDHAQRQEDSRGDTRQLRSAARWWQGSNEAVAMTIRLQREDFDAAAEAAAIARGRTDIGAVVTFAGICRDHEGGAGVTALTLEHYPGMAEEEIARHVAEAEKRWPLLGV